MQKLIFCIIYENFITLFFLSNKIENHKNISFNNLKKRELLYINDTISTHLGEKNVDSSIDSISESSSQSKEKNNFLKIIPENIISGKDVRTTIMFANIPNKYTLNMLLDLINESSYGNYTFVYLRMDFLNNCNVGYAFIDFASPIYLLDFYEICNGKRWIRFHSNKVTSITYATIQGEDRLIQKFKKSRVMDQRDGFKPVSFNTKGIFKGLQKSYL